MKNKRTNFSDQELQSKVIDFLRFPLIVGVLFIHNRTGSLVIDGQILGGSASVMPMFYYCSQFFSQIVGGLAVPLFFFISGFLFFLNIRKFNAQNYKDKLLSRVKTLLVPYLFWNMFVLAVYFLLQSVPSLSSFSNRELDWHNFFSYFWNNSGELRAGYPIESQADIVFPISYQFWFIRDLMVAVLFTPLIYCMVKYLKIWCVVILGSLWLCGFWFTISPAGFNIDCIFFFTAGTYFGLNKRTLTDDFVKFKKLSFILYPIFALADLFTEEYVYNLYIHNAGIIIGIVMCFNLVALLFEKKKIKPLPFLSAASFFVFALHEPLMKTLRKITFLVLKPETDIALTGLYFLNVIAVTVLTLGIYWVLRRCLPKLTAIITGGR